MLRWISYLSFYCYLILTFVILLRTRNDQPFQLWLAMVLPLAGIAFSLSHSLSRLGWQRTVLLFFLTVILSLTLESLGVATGLIYGPYHYTHRLGPLFLGLTPYIIPLTWYMMIYPSYRLADRCIPTRWSSRWVSSAALGALAMVAWDLAMDPLMASRQHWIWENPGFFFGVPLQNFFGWWFTAFIILFAYILVQTRLPKPATSYDHPTFDRLPVLMYALVGSGSVIDAWFAGLPGPALIGGFAMLILVTWGVRSSGNPVNILKE